MSKSTEPRINRDIKASNVRLVDHNGDMVGVVGIAEALRMAEATGLDLVEVSPGAAPPVCKILDYGKYKYEAQKKAHEARRKQKVITVKEIKVRPNIDKHDLEIKLRHVEEFLEGGDKVRISMRFRGREMDHMEIGQQVLQYIREYVVDKAKIELEPKREGRQIFMLLGPIKGA